MIPKSYTKLDSTTQIILVATICFLLLSPGFIVNIPPNSVSYCKESNQISDCANDPIGVNCEKCTKFWASRFTNISTVWWHSLIFLGILIFVYISM